MPTDLDGSGVTERETTVRLLLKRAAARVRPSQRPAPEVPFGRENDANLEFDERGTGSGVGWLLVALAVFILVHTVWAGLGAS